MTRGDRRVWLLAAIAALALFIPACGEPSAMTRRPGPRIVALSPGLGVTLRDLGWAPWIVGRHAFDAALDPSIPVCGDQLAIDYEALLRARPTHVLLEWGSRPLPDRLEALAREHGWIVRSWAMLSLADIRRGIPEIDAALRGGMSESTAPVQAPPPDAADRLLARLEEAVRPRPGLALAGKVLLLVGLSPPSALGPGSWHDEALRSMGAMPALDAGAAYQQLDFEDVLRLRPDAVVIFAPRGAGRAPGDGPGPVMDRLGRLGALDVPAFRTGRVALIDDPACLTPGSGVIAMAEALARALEGFARGGDATMPPR